jgi:hypothetical protein
MVPEDGTYKYGSSCPKQIASFPAQKGRRHKHPPSKSASYSALLGEPVLVPVKAEWLKSFISGVAGGGRQGRLRVRHPGICAPRHGPTAFIRKQHCLSRNPTFSQPRLNPHNRPFMSCQCGSHRRSSPHRRQWSLPSRRPRPRLSNVANHVSRSRMRRSLKCGHSPTPSLTLTAAQTVFAVATSSSRGGRSVVS